MHVNASPVPDKVYFTCIIAHRHCRKINFSSGPFTDSLGITSPQTPQTLSQQTKNMEEQSLNLYAKLIKEATRMEVYAMRANKDQRPELSRMYEALVLSLRAQAHRVLLQVRGFIGHSDENLSLVIDEELPTFIKEYARCHHQAVETNNKAIAMGCDHGSRITQINQQLAKRAREQRQLPDTFFICDFCGFIASAKLPETCPICTAASRRFKKVC